MVPVARRNLFAEKGRFALSVLGVAMAVMLVLVVLALYRGFSRTGETFEEMPGELWVAQAGTTDPFQSISLLEASQLQEAGQIDGVAAVIPVLIRQMTFEVEGRDAGARLVALGVPDSLQLPQATRNRFVPERGTMIVEGILSAKKGMDEGDPVNFGDVTLRVGEVQPRGTEAFEPLAFLNFEDAQEIFGSAGIVNFGMVILEPGADREQVAAALSASSTEIKVLRREELAQAIRRQIDESFLPIIGILLAIGFSVGSAVVGLTIYTATIERSRDFGVMKAVGASTGFLFRIVVSQSAMLTSAGFVLGFGAALLVARLAITFAPDFATQFRAGDSIGVLGGTVVMAAGAALVPVHRINGIDPAMVFKA
jgi:putative ABC transport system permease protein